MGDITGILADPSAGENQSTSNLFSFLRGIAGEGKRRLFGIGRQKAGALVPATVGFPDPSQFGGRGRGGAGQTGPGGIHTGADQRKWISEKADEEEADRNRGFLTKVREKLQEGLKQLEKWWEGTWLGVATRRVGQLGAAALEAGKAVYSFARAQEAEVRRLGEVGGEQAAAIALLDINRLLGDIKTARETGDTSSGLTKSLERFETALQPIESLMTNLANVVAGGLLDVAAEAVDFLGTIAKDFTTLLEELGLWKADNKAKELKKFPAQLIESIAKDQEKVDRPQWPGANVPGSPGRPTVSSPFHGGP